MDSNLESQGTEALAWVQDILKQMQQVVAQQDQRIQELQEQLQACTDKNSAQSAGLTPTIMHSQQLSPGPRDQDVVQSKDRLSKPPEFHRDRAEFRL
jgi:ABC-type transporter Mla subunit MlaD